MSKEKKQRQRIVWRVLGLLCVACFFCGLFCGHSLAQKKTTPTPAISVEAYRAQLQSARDKLRQMEDTPSRRIAPILNSLAKTQTIKRADGQTQTVSGEEWQRRGKNAKAVATRSEVRAAREAVELHLRELDGWSRSTFVPEDAQSIMQQLEGSGQIRTGPTALQQWLSDFSKWWREKWGDLLKWIGSLFPQATPGKMPTVDPNLVRAFFMLTAFALLALLAYLVWRAIGGRLGKRGARRGVLAEGEDAELLLLPPDELRERARKFAAEGNYREALRHLYVSLLLTLDARGVWRYDARRTNWEHIRELRRDQTRANLVSPLSEITRIFDRVRYGNAEFDGDDWTRFENEVAQVEAKTATS